ncbi:Ribosomal RNA large subunit methyltransferase N [Listeria monocytogenes N53-1]|nr:Ribosomal RNA large subunit methyltransferase N [Listeria monocytogenes N53-1]
MNDVIDQDDLDALTGLGFETETITNDSMQLLERAMFNNVIMEFGEDLTEFPDITTHEFMYYDDGTSCKKRVFPKYTQNHQCKYIFFNV